jgi:hypothetical protein
LKPRRFGTNHAKIELAGIVFLLVPVLVAALYLTYDPFVSGKVLLGLLLVYVVGVAGYVIALRLIERSKRHRIPVRRAASETKTRAKRRW